MALKIGDIVVLSGPHYISNSDKNHIYAEAPGGFGSAATVIEFVDEEQGSVRVSWLARSGSKSVIATDSLSRIDDLQDLRAVPGQSYVYTWAIPASMESEPLPVDPAVEQQRNSIRCHFGMGSDGEYYCAAEASYVVTTRPPCGHDLFDNEYRPVNQLYCDHHLRDYLGDLRDNYYCDPCDESFMYVPE